MALFCGVRGRQKTLRRTKGHMSAHAGRLAYEVTHRSNSHPLLLLSPDDEK